MKEEILLRHHRAEVGQARWKSRGVNEGDNGFNFDPEVIIVVVMKGYLQLEMLTILKAFMSDT